jgi:SAM-dependent methyltransferase
MSDIETDNRIGASRENGLNAENYYNQYRYFGWDLSLMYERLNKVKLPDGLQKDIQEKEKFTFLVLGSATPRNLSQIARIDKYLRPSKVEQDEVIVIDQNIYPLIDHKREIAVFEGKSGWGNMPLSTKEFPLPSYKIAQADMRALPFGENRIDCVVSDYTFNYLDNLEGIDKSFAEISRTLASNGILMISIRGNETHPYTGIMNIDVAEQDIQEKNQGGVIVHYFPLQIYIQTAQNHQLEMIGSNAIGTDLFAVLAKSPDISADSL